jgi:hypothetical protein
VPSEFATLCKPTKRVSRSHLDELLKQLQSLGKLSIPQDLLADVPALLPWILKSMLDAQHKTSPQPPAYHHLAKNTSTGLIEPYGVITRARCPRCRRSSHPTGMLKCLPSSHFESTCGSSRSPTPRRRRGRKKGTHSLNIVILMER